MRVPVKQEMLRQHARISRVVQRFPRPFKATMTPYSQTDFSEQVMDACMSNRTISVGLMLSKAIVLGDVGVGKTSLVNRFCYEVFDKNYKATIGVDFEVARFDILRVPFSLQIWDTAGQERYRSITSLYYRNAHVIIIVFDVNESRRLNNTRRWLNDALKVCGGHPHIFLVGTKTDLCSEATYQMVEEQAALMANAMKAEYWAVSSQTGDNVQNFFFRVATLAFNAGVVRELDVISPSQQIGNSLISELKIQLIATEKTYTKEKLVAVKIIGL